LQYVQGLCRFPYIGFRIVELAQCPYLSVRSGLFMEIPSEERMRNLFEERIKNLFEDRIRSLCTKAIAAKGPELQTVLSDLRTALHEHAQFLQYVTVRVTREVAEKTSSSNAAD
jgi:hypothetical protein